MPSRKLSVKLLCEEARLFAVRESSYFEPTLYGVTDGKKVGTYLEHKFRSHLLENGYAFQAGSSASGVDFPDLMTDMKVTSIRQPQSSCPFKSASQKIYGLGYCLLIFVYEKLDDSSIRASSLNILHSIFVDARHTGDYQLTRQIRMILENDGNREDIYSCLVEKNLPLDEISLENLVSEIMTNKPMQGYLTISNALQWRLQYSRVIEKAGLVDGVSAIFRQPE